LLIAENSGNNEGVTGSCVVDQDQSKQEEEEVARSVVQTHREVSNATEHRGHRDTERQFRRNLGPEVGTHLVHVVVHFSQENRTFVWENQNNILNSIHGNVHCHKEQGALNVLENTSVVLTRSVSAVWC